MGNRKPERDGARWGSANFQQKIMRDRFPHRPPSLFEASYGGEDPQVDREGEMDNMHYVYILKCSNGFYHGCTNNLKDRIKRHTSGQITRIGSIAWHHLVEYHQEYVIHK